MRGVPVPVPRLARVPGLGGWSEDPLWARCYDWIVEHPGPGSVLWAAGMHSDLRRLYDATQEVGRLPAGSRVLDVPCGGGVALRGLRPGQGVEYVAADIAPAMLERTRAAAERRGVAEQVRTRVCDVGALPDADGAYDLVVSLTGLHCFPDPARAVAEMARVLRPGGVVTGSTLRNDSGPLHEPMRRGGRLAGLLGPGLTSTELARLWRSHGVDVRVERSGALAYFRGVKA